MTHPSRIAKGMYWDRAWSLVEGCTPVSPGCDNCWAASQAHVRQGQSNEKIRTRYQGLTTEKGKWNGRIRLLQGNLDAPLRRRVPTVYSVWNDLFHEDVPDTFVDQAFSVMFLAPSHTFLVLTKRSDRMREYITTRPRDSMKSERALIQDEIGWRNYSVPWPLPNVWLGVTVESGDQIERIETLLDTPATVHYLSVEPMLGPVYLNPIDVGGAGRWGRNYGMPQIDWVICGGETGPGARPVHPDWARSLRDQCQAAGVPFFFKSWGEWYPDRKGIYERSQSVIFGNTVVHRVGKKAAGRLLDGREWNEMPGVK